MKKTIAACAALIAATATDASASDGIFYGDIKGKWDIRAYRGENGEPDFCMAHAYFAKSGSGIGLVLNTDHQAAIMLSSNKVKNGLTSGKSYTFNIFMNGQFYHTTSTLVDREIITFSLNGRGIEDLMSANSIGFETGVYRIGTYSLKYSHAAILKLQECADAVRTVRERLAVEEQQEDPSSRDLTFEDVPEEQSSRSM